MATTLKERFDRKVERSEGCWLWVGRTRTSCGYGRIWDGGSRTNPRLVLAHRVAWELAYGPVPEGLEVCHRCDTPACVRPDHLFLATHAENMADMTRKGRQAVGPQNARTKLDPDSVRSIRDRAGTVSQRALAAEYGVGKGTIQTILERRSWAYI